MQKSVEECLTEYEMAENLNDINQNPAVTGLKAIGQGLVAEIPVLGTILTDALDKGLEEFQNEKKRRLLDSIVESTSIIAPERIEAVPFIMEFARTQDAINRLANEKKIHYICNLFCNYFLKEDHGQEIDIYEEYLSQIQMLSYREIELLIQLHRFEIEGTHEHVADPYERHEKAYERLKEFAKKEMNISAGELEGIMTSISKSGFCKEETGGRIGYAGGVFCITRYFERFLSYIMERE